jgi:hypothetical protein
MLASRKRRTAPVLDYQEQLLVTPKDGIFYRLGTFAGLLLGDGFT